MCCCAGCATSKRKDSKTRMESPSLFPLAKRLLFPYSGEDPLSLKQSLRVVLAWMLVFPLPFSICTMIVPLLEGLSAQGIMNSFLFAFCSGAFIFGLLGLLIVVMSNRSARIRQAWKAQNGRS